MAATSASISPPAAVAAAIAAPEPEPSPVASCCVLPLTWPAIVAADFGGTVAWFGRAARSNDARFSHRARSVDLRGLANETNRAVAESRDTPPDESGDSRAHRGDALATDRCSSRWALTNHASQRARLCVGCQAERRQARRCKRWWPASLRSEGRAHFGCVNFEFRWNTRQDGGRPGRGAGDPAD
jgi:hypothetical protein